MNRLLNIDCINAFKKIKATSVDLIYLDPPFFTQKKQKQRTRDNCQEFAFDDSWASINSYTKYMKERLEVCRDLLKETGSIFLHCDKSASHYLRVILDEVFGYNNFQSEIIWSYRRWSNAKKGLLNCHQVIFFYSKSKNFKFNHAYQDYSPTTNLDQIFQERVKNENGRSSYKKDGNKSIIIERKRGVPLSDVWEIPYLNPKAKERVGYPTQKPILLLDRIIKLVTHKGDLVLDPFCGSGTTLVAAKLLNRKYIGIDLSRDAIELSKKRLANPIKSESNLMKHGKDSYINQSSEIAQFLGQINAYPVQRNKGIDGFAKIGKEIKPIPIKIQKSSEKLSDAKKLLLQACKRNDFQTKILIVNEGSTSNLFEEKNNLHIIHKKRVNSKTIGTLLAIECH